MSLGGVKLYARTNGSRQAVERNDQTGAYLVTDLFYHFGRSLCRFWNMEVSLTSAWGVNFTADSYDCLSFIAYERSLCGSHPRTQKAEAEMRVFEMKPSPPPNHTLQPTRVGAGSSAIADGALWSRVAQLSRWQTRLKLFAQLSC